MKLSNQKMGKITGMTAKMKTPKVIILLLALFAMTAALGWGQTNTGGFLGTPEEDVTSTDAPKGSSVFLLDPSRFKINHTISTSYASIGGRGVLTSMYLADISYKLANPLDIRISLGVANTQGSFFGPKGSANSIIPGFQLHYHPSNSFNLIVNYQQYPAGAYYYPGYLPLGYRR
ncbi:MAG TPA: hypothetical protein VFR89_07570 [candidate division Zixibacteria bacterium]|nr:hypothetical protein [candidate division Zixibacteria bacterium]